MFYLYIVTCIFASFHYCLIIVHIHEPWLVNRLTFVFKYEDCSSVSYTVNKGLVKPASPKTSKQWREKEEKKSNLETEIRKNTSHLYELAKTLCENSDQGCNANSVPDTDTVESEKSINIDATVEPAITDISVESKSSDISLESKSIDITVESKSTDS